MRTKLLFTIVGLLALSQIVHGQGTAFTYQGRLTDNGTPANGVYDLRFTIYDDIIGGNRVGNPITNASVAVAEGTFTVTLDFGSGIFPGANRWLEIGVRTNGPAGAFTTLSPLQAFTAAPYAITAGAVTDANVSRLDVPNTASTATGVPTVTSGFITAATVLQSGLGYQSPPTVTVTDITGSGAVIIATLLGGKVVALTVQSSGTGYSSGATLTISPPPSNALQTFITPNFFTGINTMTNPGNILAGSFTGDGARLTNVNAATLDGLTAPSFWQLGGNGGSAAGTNFLGTTDNQALELKVNNMRALRLEPNTNGAPNVIAGSPVNTVAPGVVGATISGGGAPLYFGDTDTNVVSADFGTVGGGANNMVATMARYSTVGGGKGNAIQTDAISSTIGGGVNNVIQTNVQDCTIGGGGGNTIQTAANFSTIGGGVNNIIRTNAHESIIGGGVGNAIQTDAAYSTIGGGANNVIQTNAQYSTIAGGEANTIAGFYATIPGGYLNTAAGDYSFAAGYTAQALHPGAFVWADTIGPPFPSQRNDQFRVRANGGVRLDLNSTNWVEFYGQEVGRPPFQFGLLITTSTGAYLSSGGSWVNSSDRNLKENFEPLDGREALEKVAALPITRWNYKAEGQSVKHIGPVAQDFQAAFKLSADDQHIATVDEEGVALAALQGLNQKVEEKSARIKELEARIERLERLLNAKDQFLK